VRTVLHTCAACVLPSCQRRPLLRSAVAARNTPLRACAACMRSLQGSPRAQRRERGALIPNMRCRCNCCAAQTPQPQHRELHGAGASNACLRTLQFPCSHSHKHILALFTGCSHHSTLTCMLTQTLKCMPRQLSPQLPAASAPLMHAQHACRWTPHRCWRWTAWA
jgi:hypothetical protein